MIKQKRKIDPNKTYEKTRVSCARLMLIPVGFFALCTVCSVIGMNWFIGEMGAIGEPANLFMHALEDRDTETAFALLSSGTQSEWGSPAYMLEFIPQPEDWQFSSFSIRNGLGTISGTVQFEDGSSDTLQIRMINQDGWKITGINFGEE